MKQLRQIRFPEALAEVYHEPMAIQNLLYHAELPAAKLPNIGAAGNAQNLWDLTMVNLEQGIVPGGLERLVRRASKDYPGNPVFQKALALVDGPSEPALKTILCIASNPQRHFDTGGEIAAVKRAMAGREDVRVEMEPAANREDLARHLVRYRPTVLHISCRGEPARKPGEQERLLLTTRTGEEGELCKEHLRNMIRALNEGAERPIRLVVLNACYSEPIARTIAGETGAAIGYETAVNDGEALTFARSLYETLAERANLGTAFNLARNQLDIEDQRGGTTRVRLHTRGQHNPQRMTLFPGTNEGRA